MFEFNFKQPRLFESSCDVRANRAENAVHEVRAGLQQVGEVPTYVGM
jgi:hypothetical protein